MLTLARLTDLLMQMPNKLTSKEISKKECKVIWDFLTTNNRLSISQHMLKIQLANECNVTVERLMEVAGDEPFVDVLTWESTDEPSEYTLNEAVELLRNAHDNNNWVLEFSRNISADEGYIIWRWAVNYRWSYIRNRFKKWLMSQSNLSHEFSLDIYLAVIYDGLKIENKSSAFKKLQAWGGDDTPKKWWFITDCSTLNFIGDGLVRNRDGSLNPKYTPLLEDKSIECWMWENPLGTGCNHTVDVELPFSRYKEPMFHEWHESQVLLESYPKGGFLITHENNYYLYTNGTNILYGQLLSVRNLDKGGFEFVIGFNDAGEIVDVTTLRVDVIPFTVNNALKVRGVYANVRFMFQNIEDCLVAKFNYTWNPNNGWHLKLLDVENNMGIHDIDDILDYIAITGGEDES
jgi:hypothetical protein